MLDQPNGGTDGPDRPSWLLGASDQALRAEFGLGTFTRGQDYARRGAVLALESDPDDQHLSARVRGSGSKVYRTVVDVDHGHGGQPIIGGRCTCPMQVDCKHVVATVLTLRDRWPAGATYDDPGTARPRHARPGNGLTPATPARPAWESALADLARPLDAGPDESVLGLELELATVKAGRYTAGPPMRVKLRPVTMGKSGRWITTGVSWRELETGYSRVRLRPEHREIALRLLTLQRSSHAGYIGYGDPQLHLGALGPGVWALLREAVARGVALVPGGRRAGSIELGEPVEVRLDLRRAVEASESDDTADVELRVQLDLSEPAPAPDGPPVLLGEPAHGLAIQRETGLWLAPLRPTLEPALARLWQSGPLTIPAQDLPRFLVGYYPGLRQRVPIGSPDGSVPLPEIAPPRLVVEVELAAGHQALLAWAFDYRVGSTRARLPLAGPADPTVVPVRDRVAERTLLERAATIEELDLLGLRVPVGGQQALVPQQRLQGLATATLLTEVLPALDGLDGIDVEVHGEPARYAEADEPPVIAVATRDDPNSPDWFDLDVTVTIAGESVPLAPLITALTHGEEHVLLDSGTWFRLDRPELTALARLLEEARALQDRPGAQLRLAPVHAGLWEELVELGVVAEQSQRWQQRAGALLRLTELPTPDPPAQLTAQLRPYQLAGYQWLSLLWDLRLGGVLADDMGLGKTLQTLATLARAHERGELGGEVGPALVVAPTSVVATWAHEAAAFCPQLRVATITETAKRSGQPIAEVAAAADVVVTSYALARIDDEDYRACRWAALVLDEAQAVKNHRAKTYQAVRRIDAPFRLAITGTPLENSLMDLWSMLSIAAPGLFPNPQRFTEVYRRPIEAGADPARLAALHRRVRPLMLRRTKDQVATDLPPRIEQVLEVTLEPAHRKIYDRQLARERQRVLKLVEDLDRNRFEILRSLTVLRQLALDASLVEDKHAGKVGSAKIDTLVEQLHELAEEGHRALVFSQFTGFLALVRARLQRERIGHVYLDGRTRDRARRIAEFTEGSHPVFLISLKAGGVGLTLTEADYVFVLDPWWNPATEAQAIDRAHRIGQDKTVMVYRLVATDTIEEKVVALQARKRELFAQVVDGGAMSEPALSAADIRGLFEPSPR